MREEDENQSSANRSQPNRAGRADDAVLICGNPSRNGQHKGLSEVTCVRDRAARNLTPLDDAGLMWRRPEREYPVTVPPPSYCAR